MKILELFQNSACGNNRINRPYIIAEAGVNHEGDMSLAYRLINEAAEGGAHAIKFQTYKAEKISIKDSPSYWDLSEEVTETQYKLFKKYDKFWKKEFEELKSQCDKVGIEFISTPFDTESAKFLNDLMDVFKISSSDITNKPFIDYISSFSKPIILSTGASYLHEIQQAVQWIDQKQIPLALLHCVLNYPTDDACANLGMIQDLKLKFSDKVIGYSDHTLPREMKVLEVATLLGAVILEKHFTHDKGLPGNDHYHAMDKNDLQKFCRSLDTLFELLGSSKKHPLLQEASARKNARRSLVAAKDIGEGAVVTCDDLTWKRPASGISPMEIDSVIGKRAIRSILADEVITWNILQ